MKAFEMLPAPIIRYGENEALNLEAQLKRLHATSAVIVCDKGVYDSGLLEPLLKEIKEIPYVVFHDIQPESPDTVVEHLRDFAKDHKADAFVSVGGGSTIDTARAALLLSDTEGPVSVYFEKWLEKAPTDISYICIPTTAGTGAEMSAGGPIYNTKTSTKQALLLPPKQPDMVILDPVMTVSLPPYVTYTTAMDALAHSIEAMTGKRRNAMTDMICGQAVEYIWGSLPKVMEDPKDLDGRGKLLLSSNMAIGCQSLRHLGHAVCQPVGAAFHLAHGYTCAAVLPATVRHLASAEGLKEVWEMIAARMGITGEKTAGENIADALWKANKKYQIPTLKQKGLRWEDVLKCKDEIMGDGRLLPNCPIEVKEEDVVAVLSGMYNGLD